MSKEERKSYMSEIKAKHQELETWANENGIDMKYLGFFKMKHFEGPAGGMAKNMMFTNNSQ